MQIDPNRTRLSERRGSRFASPSFELSQSEIDRLVLRSVLFGALLFLALILVVLEVNAVHAWWALLTSLVAAPVGALELLVSRRTRTAIGDLCAAAVGGVTAGVCHASIWLLVECGQALVSTGSLGASVHEMYELLQLQRAENLVVLVSLSAPFALLTLGRLCSWSLGRQVLTTVALCTVATLVGVVATALQPVAGITLLVMSLALSTFLPLAAWGADAGRRYEESRRGDEAAAEVVLGPAVQKGRRAVTG